MERGEQGGARELIVVIVNGVLSSMYQSHQCCVRSPSEINVEVAWDWIPRIRESFRLSEYEVRYSCRVRGFTVVMSNFVDLSLVTQRVV